MALVSLKREPDDYPTEYFENHFGYCTASPQKAAALLYGKEE